VAVEAGEFGGTRFLRSEQVARAILFSANQAQTISANRKEPVSPGLAA